MKPISKLCFFLSLFFLVLSFVSCNKSSVGKLIITQVPAGHSEFGTATGINWRFNEGSQIAMIDPEKPSSIKVLTGDFYSACSPDISPDGKRILFAAQQKENDPWQIWVMDLRSRKYQKMADFKGNCTDPVFLPTNKVIFTGKGIESDSSTGGGHDLYVCNADGSGVQQITFRPHANFATTLLKDGRLLVITRQLMPAVEDPVLMVIRPDGTKSDVFYKGKRGTTLIAKSHEADGLVYFVEADSNHYSSVISIRYNRPLHSRVQVSGRMNGYFSSVFPAADGKLLVTYRENATKSFEVFEMDSKEGKLGNRIYGHEGYDITEVMQVNEHPRPKKLPSEVDMGVKTGLILCQDINYSGLGIKDPNAKKATKIEVMGIDSSMGIIRVEKDGSFYLKIMADQPFKIRTLDDNNQVVSGTCSWLWLRPNERRGCVGCHEDQEVAPMNQVPLAVKKEPVLIPLISAEIQEKEVELE
jgi:hypothetical protein